MTKNAKAKVTVAEIKPKGLVQEENLFVSHNEFLFGKKPGEGGKNVVSVDDEKDFPTLGAAIPKSSQNESRKPQPKFDPFAPLHKV